MGVVVVTTKRCTQVPLEVMAATQTWPVKVLWELVAPTAILPQFSRTPLKSTQNKVRGTSVLLVMVKEVTVVEPADLLELSAPQVESGEGAAVTMVATGGEEMAITEAAEAGRAKAKKATGKKAKVSFMKRSAE
jgi:hypothetical protein